MQSLPAPHSLWVSLTETATSRKRCVCHLLRDLPLYVTALPVTHMCVLLATQPARITPFTDGAHLASAWLCSGRAKRGIVLHQARRNVLCCQITAEHVPHCNTFLACRHPNVRIEAHKVYNEYIQDKQHIHMNATKFITLSEYVKFLGREGHCTVEESPKGWFIRLIHRDVQQVRALATHSSRRTASLSVRCECQ